jgi:hypothetical protein
MPNIYVNSADGLDADNGSTWALAKATLAGAAAIDAAGDTIFIKNTHSQTGAGTTHAFAGTAGNPVRVLSVSDSNEPATTLATGATINANATNGGSYTGSAYVYGLLLSSSQAASGGITFNSGTGQSQEWDTCTFRLTANDNRPQYAIGPTSGAPVRTTFRNCAFRFGHASQTLLNNMSNTDFIGCSIESGGTAASTFLVFSNDRGSAGRVRFMGCDFANLATAATLCTMNADSYVEFINCKLPASWSGTVAGTMTVGSRAAMYNCDAGDTNYRLQIEDYAGTIRSETTIVLSGGASDGTTPLSWRMAGNANTNELANVLYSDWIAVWNEDTGASKTMTIEVITDGVTLTDATAWLEVMHMGTSGFPLGTIVRDKRAGVLTSAANQTSSSATWTTTGLASPVKQKLEATFTPQEKGVVYARVALAANAVVYVDPKPTIS